MTITIYLVVLQVAITIYLVFVCWTPGWQKWFGVCDTLPQLKANCRMIANRTAPFPALLVATMTPMILTTIYGIQWTVCCGIAVLVNVPALFYLLVYQSADTYLTCTTTFVTASFFATYIAHLTMRQERETFVWRKVALSETKLENERTFNAFLCHEIRNPVSPTEQCANA